MGILKKLKIKVHSNKNASMHSNNNNYNDYVYLIKGKDKQFYFTMDTQEAHFAWFNDAEVKPIRKDELKEGV